MFFAVAVGLLVYCDTSYLSGPWCLLRLSSFVGVGLRYGVLVILCSYGVLICVCTD